MCDLSCESCLNCLAYEFLVMDYCISVGGNKNGLFTHGLSKTWTNQLQKLNFHDLLKLNSQIYYADMHWLAETSFSIQTKETILTHNQTQNNEQSAFWMTALI